MGYLCLYYLLTLIFSLIHIFFIFYQNTTNYSQNLSNHTITTMVLERLKDTFSLQEAHCDAEKEQKTGKVEYLKVI